MMWVVWIVGALVALVAVVYGVGAALPAEHVARVERVVAGPPETVAQLIRDVRGYERWRGVKIELLSEDTGRVRYRETNGGDAIIFELVEVTPEAMFKNTILNEDLAFDGYWSIDLLPEGTGTDVAIEEHGRVKNPLFRFLSRFVFGHTSTMEKYLDALSAAAKR